MLTESICTIPRRASMAENAAGPGRLGLGAARPEADRAMRRASRSDRSGLAAILLITTVLDLPTVQASPQLDGKSWRNPRVRRSARPKRSDFAKICNECNHGAASGSVVP